MATTEFTLTGDGDSSSQWGNACWGIAYHDSTNATLQYSPDDGTTWRDAPDNNGNDATWTAAGHKVVLIPPGAHVQALDGDVVCQPMSAEVRLS